MTNIKERVLCFAKNQGVSYELFCKEIGMTYGSFKGEAKKRPLNSDAIENILSIYPNLSPVWLISGKGEMLQEVKNPVFYKKNSNIDAVNEPINPYGKPKFLEERVADLEKRLKELEKEIKK